MTTPISATPINPVTAPSAPLNLLHFAPSSLSESVAKGAGICDIIRSVCDTFGGSIDSDEGLFDWVFDCNEGDLDSTKDTV